MNETIQTILKRRSCRGYDKRGVESDKIKVIVECALVAPSARNQQPWHLSVVTNREMLDEITAANKVFIMQSDNEMFKKMASEPGFDVFRNAPMAVIVSGEKDWGYSMADCANAIENMAIAAESLGLNSCYLGSFKNALVAPGGEALCARLGIPETHEPMLALAIGYGNEKLGERQPRRENTVTYVD